MAFGVVMGSGAVLSMLLSIRLQPGVMFDLRSSLVAIAGLFGGPASSSLAMGIAGAFRLWSGGPGVPVGIANILASGALGTGGYFLVGKVVKAQHVYLLAVMVSLVWLLSLSALPPSRLGPILVPLVIAVMAVTMIATVVAGLAVLQARRASEERLLLRAAISHSPEFQFVKNEHHQFVAVNREVSTLNGFKRPEAMIGLTDFDIAPSDRAAALLSAERGVMVSGEPIHDFEECLVENGRERWFSTSKSAIRDEGGKIIGLAGVTRDITSRRAMEQDLIDSRNLLDFAVSEIADGLAMFDNEGRLEFCNDRYRTLFPLTGHVRQPGTHIRHIMQAVVESGEQTNSSGLNDAEWIERVVASLRSGGDEQISLFDGRWLHLRTRATPSGAAMVLASDFTDIKRSEERAIALACELRTLAATDSLTGLMNRRSFDNQLDAAMATARSGGSELSLLMIDVDNFKLYNDTYGHVEGDRCLKQIARCIREAIRPGDIPARYGGEEFAVILPGASGSTGCAIADRIRSRISDGAIPHPATALGYVSASIGVATVTETGDPFSITEFVSMADRALYDAKSKGRNAISLWQAPVLVKTKQLP